MIDQRAPVLEIQKQAKELGMIDLRGAGLLALAHGVTSVQEIMRTLVAGAA
jgi:type II secretory ATPase GspE/PulE/Tfp pilus assembly ATPase PilB-like protein